MMSVQAAGSDVEAMDTQSFARTPQMSSNVASSMLSGDSTETKNLTNVQMPVSAVEQSAPAAAPTSQGTATTDLDLLLVGKSGVGKSATGNSILGKKVFKSSASLNSETDKISSDVSKVKGRIVKVVDGPGVGDTRMDTDEGIRLFVESMEHAMITNPAGYHAFLLVLRFGTRFTQEDIDTIALLKKVFGNDFVKDYCILVMTCGDMFKYEAEENDIDFKQWVQQQTGAMAELVKECQDRIVLFDNFTKKNEEKSAQIDQLVELIGTLKNNGKRYTDGNFQNALEAREKVIAESKVPLARDGTLEAITLLMQELGHIRGRGAESEDIETSEQIVQDLERLLKNAATVKKDVTEQDKGTRALLDLIQSVETVEKSIISSLELHKLAVESRRQQQQSETEVASRMRELEEQIQGAKEEEERKSLMEENAMLKTKLMELERERNEEKMRYAENFNNTWSDFDHCQGRIINYQRQRESIIVTGLKVVFEVVSRPVKKLWSLVKRL
ncbi:immune-associated nucleotide-binding protein 6 [Elysia marginata]|uniref:Immune-associated nucleotide-binding protein 6 n=1 Tax=Elysia marginata TaxID=1093978 RepID=A0AAV4GL70_9GAST|nr:immune-associated nucleotide-binding protein 6 [Elysia marginata]